LDDSTSVCCRVRELKLRIDLPPLAKLANLIYLYIGEDDIACRTIGSDKLLRLDAWQRHQEHGRYRDATG